MVSGDGHTLEEICVGRRDGAEQSGSRRVL